MTLNYGLELILALPAQAAEFGEDVGLKSFDRVAKFLEPRLVERSVNSQRAKRPQRKCGATQRTLQLNHRQTGSRLPVVRTEHAWANPPIISPAPCNNVSTRLAVASLPEPSSL